MGEQKEARREEGKQLTWLGTVWFPSCSRVPYFLAISIHTPTVSRRAVALHRVKASILLALGQKASNRRKRREGLFILDLARGETCMKKVKMQLLGKLVV